MTTTESWTTSAAIRLTALTAAALLLAFAAVLSTSGSLVGRTAAGGAPTQLSMSPLNNIGPAGTDITIDILIDSVDDLGAYELAVAYDPNVLQFESWDEDGLLVSNGLAQGCQDPSFPSLGIVVLACSTVDQGGPSGSGRIGELAFSTSCSGQSMITFGSTSLNDTSGADILHSQAAGAFVLLTPVDGSEPCSDDMPTPSQPDEEALTPTPTPTVPSTDTPVPPTSTPPNGCGDANGSGTVDAVDAALVLFKIAGLLPNLAHPNNADVDGNGRLDSIDVLQILQVSAGLISRGALNCL